MRRELKGIALGLFGCALVGSAAAKEGDIEVRISQKLAAEGRTCTFEVVNHSQEPIVSFAVGGNVELAGPYELPGTLRASDISGPDGWDTSLLSQSPAQQTAVEWQAKGYDHGVMPGATQGGFSVRTSTPGFPCATGHWTAINRDSELRSGLLREPGR